MVWIPSDPVCYEDRMAIEKARATWSSAGPEGASGAVADNPLTVTGGQSPSKMVDNGTNATGGQSSENGGQ